MTYYDIYLTALSLIGEAENTSSTADYQKRAERLFVHINAGLYSLHLCLGGDEIDSGKFFIETLDTLFLLDERLVLTAALELASLLIIDKLPSISEMLKARAEAEKKNVADMATSISSTREVYGV